MEIQWDFDAKKALEGVLLSGDHQGVVPLELFGLIVYNLLCITKSPGGGAASDPAPLLSLAPNSLSLTHSTLPNLKHQIKHIYPASNTLHPLDLLFCSEEYLDYACESMIPTL